MTRILAFILSITLSGMAAATPKVVTSIPPVQGLVADIMYGAGTPVMLLDGTVSTHDFSLRPSQARELADADMVFAIGLGLEAWLSENNTARFFYLGDAEGLTLYNMRSLKEFHDTQEIVSTNDELDYSPEYSAEDEEFSATDPEVEAFINELIDGGDPINIELTETHDHENTPGRIDPHIWLDPNNTLLLIDAITETLSAYDLVNEAIYRDNARRMKQDIRNAIGSARFSLDRLSNINFVATHDSLQYLERAYDLHVIGALSSGHGVMAGARSLSGIYEQIGPGSCILVDISEPQGITGNPFGEVPTVEIDPLGAKLIGTPGYYPKLLETLAAALSNCRQ